MSKKLLLEMTSEETETLWRKFSGDWEMFTCGALYETFPEITPWELLDYKRNAWLGVVDDFIDNRIEVKP